MPVAPSFETLRPNDGLDGSAVPPWLMVPLAGSKTIRLRHAAGMTVSTGAPGVVTVVELPPNPLYKGDRILQIKAVASGTTIVSVGTTPGPAAARLECCVKVSRTVRVAFNFVRDSVGHSTTRTAASVDGWVTVMNRILQPQANVEIKKHNVQTVTVGQNLRKVVRFSAHLPGTAPDQHEWGVVTALGDTTADFNVFFVWEYEQDTTALVDNTDAGTLGANCIFEDNAGYQIGETLSHETGHHLGPLDRHASSMKKYLMYALTDIRGRRLSKAEVNMMNP